MQITIHSTFPLGTVPFTVILSNPCTLPWVNWMSWQKVIRIRIVSQSTPPCRLLEHPPSWIISWPSRLLQTGLSLECTVEYWSSNPSMLLRIESWLPREVFLLRGITWQNNPNNPPFPVFRLDPNPNDDDNGSVLRTDFKITATTKFQRFIGKINRVSSNVCCQGLCFDMGHLAVAYSYNLDTTQV